jgi:hypothetical protein
VVPLITRQRKKSIFNELEKAGMEKTHAELQKQIDEWAKTKK